MGTSGKQTIKEIRDKAIQDMVEWIGIDPNEKLSPKKARHVEKLIQSHITSKQKQFYNKPNDNFSSIQEILIDLFMDWQKAGSTAEKKMYELMHKAGIEFSYQYRIANYRVDFFIEPNHVIELDGSQHGLATNKAGDEIRDKKLTELGYDILRIPLILLILEPDEVIKALKGLPE